MSSSVVSVQVEIISLCKNLQKFKQFLSFSKNKVTLLYLARDCGFGKYIFTYEGNDSR